MPTETYNRVEELEEKIGYTDDSVGDPFLRNLLESGHRDMERRVGRHFTDNFTLHKLDSNDDLDVELELSFRPVFKVNEVVRMDTRKTVDGSNYTVDKEAGTVTFSDGFRDDELYRGINVQVKHVPRDFKDLELWCAILESQDSETVQFEDSIEASSARKAQVKARTIENQINAKVGPGAATDGNVRRGTK